jgi:hypothetical protein
MDEYFLLYFSMHNANHLHIVAVEGIERGVIWVVDSPVLRTGFILYPRHAFVEREQGEVLDEPCSMLSFMLKDQAIVIIIEVEEY